MVTLASETFRNITGTRKEGNVLFNKALNTWQRTTQRKPAADTSATLKAMDLLYAPFYTTDFVTPGVAHQLE